MADRKFIAKSTAARSFRKCEKSNHKTYLWIRAFLYHLAFNGIIWNEKCLTDKKMKTNLWILLVDRLVILHQQSCYPHILTKKQTAWYFYPFFVCCCIRLSALWAGAIAWRQVKPNLVEMFLHQTNCIFGAYSPIEPIISLMSKS